MVSYRQFNPCRARIADNGANAINFPKNVAIIVIF
jgi:hypothetical protein